MAGDGKQIGNRPSSGALYGVLVLAAGGAGGFTLAVLSPGAWDSHAQLAGAGAAALTCLLLAGAMLSMVAGAQPVAPEKGAMAQAAPDERGGRTAPNQGLAFEVSGPVLDENALDALLRLGGDAFVTEVAAQFSAEGTLLLLKVARAVGEADAAEFASHTHALRSSAANVGARRLYQLCLQWRETPACELAISGSARFVLLQKEFDAAQRALKAWRHKRTDGAAEPAAIRA